MKKQHLSMYISTALKMKPKMIVYRIVLRGLRRFLAFFPLKVLESSFWLLATRQNHSRTKLKNLKGFVPIESLFNEKDLIQTATDFRGGFVEAIGERQAVLSFEDRASDNWLQENTSLLYRFNLHYFEWAWGMGNALDLDERNDLFEIFFDSWYCFQKLFRVPEWSPYVASLRAVVLVDILNRWNLKDETQLKISKIIIQSYGFLRLFREKDVEGNHLIKNLKALIIVGCLLNDRKKIIKYLKELKDTLKYQILDDGSHYERSTFYHVQVLVDLSDIKNAVESFNAVDSDLNVSLVWLRDHIENMKLWLWSMRTLDGGIWLVNDACRVNPKLLDYLTEPDFGYEKSEGINYDNELKSIPGGQLNTQPINSKNAILDLSKIAGYFIFNNHRGLSACFDVGEPCPKELPAHSHADTLNVLMYFDKNEILCDSGVSVYESGPRREYERSTKAHNSLTIDSLNSTEVWGSFRAGRRAGVKLVKWSDNEDQIMIEGVHTGYSYLVGSPTHDRSVTLLKKLNRLEISDNVQGSYSHNLEWFFHFPKHVKLKTAIPKDALELKNTSLQFQIENKSSTNRQENTLAGTFKVSIETEIDYDIEYIDDDSILSTRAINFGTLEPSSVLRVSYEGELPVAVKFVFDDFVLFA